MVFSLELTLNSEWPGPRHSTRLFRVLVDLHRTLYDYFEKQFYIRYLSLKHSVRRLLGSLWAITKG